MSGSSDYTITTNLGLFKPNYDMDDGAWGGHLNTNADTLDSAIHALQTTSVGVTSWNTRTGAVTLTTADVTTALPPSSTTPLMDGLAAVGAATTWARADHVHPTDSTRYAASNPAGYPTLVQTDARYLPLAGGTLTGPLIGTAATFSGNASFGNTGANAHGMTGTLTLTGDIHVSGGNYVTGPGQFNSTLTVANAGIVVNNSAAANADLQLSNTAAVWHLTNGFNGNVSLLLNAAQKFAVDLSGSTYNTSGTWTTFSDPRVKSGQAPYTTGLGAILQLKPITYAYNGLAGTPDDAADPEAPTRYGLDALATQGVMPELVQSSMVKLRPEDAEASEVLTLSGGLLVFALVNACQELAVRIEALEAAATPPAREA